MNTNTLYSEPLPELNTGLVNHRKCIEKIWPHEDSRMCERSFKKLQADGCIPYVKIGRRIYFDPEEVRQAINKQFKVEAK